MRIRRHNQRGTSQLLQRLPRGTLRRVNVLVGTEFARKLLLVSTSRDGDSAIAELVGELHAQVAETAQPFDRNRLAGADTLLSDRVEDGHACAELGRVLGCVDAFGDAHAGFGAEVDVLGVWEGSVAGVASIF